MYHSFLIHSSADGHLGCFHVLAIINSTVINIGVHVSEQDLMRPSQDRHPHACLPPAFCLYESFSQRIHLVREVRKCRKDNIQGRQNNTPLSVQQSQVSLVLP